VRFFPPKKNPKRIQTQFSSASTTPFWTSYGVYMGYIYIYIYINNLLPFEDTQTNKKQNLLVPDPQLFLATLKVAPLGQI
jgi:hypothetical protein